jgi:hypothetical protein
MDKETAKDILRDADSPTFACLKAADHLLTNQWLAWEPETVWLELNHLGVTVPVGNRSQLLAGRSLILTGRHFYDALVYEKTCITFNNEEPNYDALDDAPVEFMAATHDEVQRISLTYLDETYDYDREPVEYTAVQLYRAGLVYAPESLQWAQARLDSHYPKETQNLKKEVMEAWAAAPKDKLSDTAYPETPVGVQLAKLAVIQLFVEQKRARLTRQMAKFGL